MVSKINVFQSNVVHERSADKGSITYGTGICKDAGGVEGMASPASRYEFGNLVGILQEAYGQAVDALR